MTLLGSSSSKMKPPNFGPPLKDRPAKRSHCCSAFLAMALICAAFLVWNASVTTNYNKSIVQRLPVQAIQPLQAAQSVQLIQSNSCQTSCEPSGSEALPKGIVTKTSNLEMVPLWGSPNTKKNAEDSKSLLGIAVGIKQKETVDKIVTKFLSSNFTIMLFHYDGSVDDWRDLRWSSRAIHVSAINQTKWWFAKRFLHPDIVSEYSYIFLWDEDLEVENFHPGRYISIVQEEGLEISQPALEFSKSEVHHQITVRGRRAKVHRRYYKFSGSVKCFKNSTGPPCTGWVEMMAPVFSRASWRCAWHLIQNDLIHAWGLDMKLGYCAQGDRTQKVGVVDSEYIVHKGIPSLGGPDVKPSTAETQNGYSESKNSLKGERQQQHGSSLPRDNRYRVRRRSYVELDIFVKRWQQAVAEDKCWIDPYMDTKS